MALVDIVELLLPAWLYVEIPTMSLFWSHVLPAAM